MRPIAELRAADAGALRGVLTDLDDTLTTAGRIDSAAFGSLWRLRDAGLRVVLVTGRPAGWADHLARMWPLDAVVGENGAFYFARRAERVLRRYQKSDSERRADRARLDALSAEILGAVPRARVAADQAYRESDLAIDVCEEIEPLSRAEVAAVLDRFERAGARAKLSSIHVNGWFGDFDKLTTLRLLFSEQFGEDLDAERARYLYVGDSPNDEPAFGYFPLSAGVANIARFASGLTSPPAFVARQSGGAGFAEIAEVVLAARVAPPGRIR